MARITLTQRVESIDERLEELDRAFENHRAIADFHMDHLEAELTERAKIDDQLQAKFAEQAAKNAAMEEKIRMLEKLSDRGWQGWLALIGAGLALLVAFLKR